MRDVLILYESKTGYSKKYAEWISEETQSACHSLKEITDEMLEKADVIVFGSGVNGSVLNGLNTFSRKMKKYPEKKIIYFATGIRPATKRTCELIRKNNFKKKVDYFYLRGGFNLNQLTPGDKTLIRIYCAMIRRRKNIHEEDEEIITLLKHDADFSTREQIQSLIQAIELHSNDELKGANET